MKEDGKHEEEKSKNHFNNKAEQGQQNSGPQRKGKKKGHQLHICERREESTQIEVIYRTRKKNVEWATKPNQIIINEIKELSFRK